MRRQSSRKKIGTWFFSLECATLARRERIALPSELARESGSRLDPMSLRAECDHLVIGLALRRLCRRTVITPRLASIPNFLLKAFLFLLLWFSQASPSGPTPGTLFFLGNFIRLFTQTLPSHPILLGVSGFMVCGLRRIHNNQKAFESHFGQRSRSQPCIGLIVLCCHPSNLFSS